MKAHILVLGFLLLTVHLQAQQDLTIYHMQAIPQSNYSNPAIIPTPKWHLGFPMLSSVYADIGHTGFNTHQFMKIVSEDSVELNFQKLLKKLAKHNYVNLNYAQEYLSFGFKIKDKHYVNFAVNNKFYTRFCYPKTLIEFIYKGNGAFFDETLSFNKLSLNMAHYNEYMLGYALKYNDKLTLGVHIKFLQGLSNLYMKKTNITLLTEEEHFFITGTSNIDLYGSMPESVWQNDTTENEEGFDFVQYITNFSNIGLGVDLGATYKFSDKLTLGLSIIDFGFIKWNSGTRNFKSAHPGGSFTFEGIDINDFISQGDTTGAQNNLDNLLDSIAEIFSLDTLYGSYTSPLNSRLYFSGALQLTPKDQLNGLLRLHFYNQTVHAGFSLGYLRKVGNILSLSATYTMANRSYFNIGFGMAANLGPLQIYFTTDNIISPFVYNKYYWTEGEQLQSLTLPRNTKFMNAHFGINFVFGYLPPKENVSIF